MTLKFSRVVWEFVVGDDWPTAVGVVLSLAVTALVATSDLAAWWLMPLAALAAQMVGAAPSGVPIAVRLFARGRRQASGRLRLSSVIKQQIE